MASTAHNNAYICIRLAVELNTSTEKPYIHIPAQTTLWVADFLHGNRNRRKGRGHGALCAIQHLGVRDEPGGSGRRESVRGVIDNCAPQQRSPRSRHRRAQRARQNKVTSAKLLVRAAQHTHKTRGPALCSMWYA